MKLGVLLFNLGGPETLADVRPFLYNLFSDPEIIRLPVRAMQKPLAWLISTLRSSRSASQYAQIGGGSPLRRLSQMQADALREELARRGVTAQTYLGMRYWRPFTRDTLDQITRDGITDLVILPLYPQFSVSTTGSSAKDFIAELQRRGGLRDIRRHYITRWHTQDGYINAIAAIIEEQARALPDQDPRNIHLLYSAHSVPQSYIAKGDPYLRHIQETIALVNTRLGNCFPSHLSFQSKVGPVKWLEPATEEKLKELGAEGIRQLLVIPIAFVSDHIETLYELDIEYGAVARAAGITHYVRVPALNTRPDFIAAMADLVCARLATTTKQQPN
ncbi:MAG: ferrochelatase [Blastocatellia bacterium]